MNLSNAPLTYVLNLILFVNNINIVSTFALPSGLALPLIFGNASLEFDRMSAHPAIRWWNLNWVQVFLGVYRCPV